MLWSIFGACTMLAAMLAWFTVGEKALIRYLKEKVDAGCDFLTTQMFFDNNLLYNFLYKIREAGIP